MDESVGVATFFGIVLGVMLVIAVVVIGFDLGAERIKTASLSVSPPLIFVPK
jgi:putative Ca2+/H+ antiporter (TMEM165/GDT1 family)